MANLEVQRRLAAILAADVAGYTRLMEQDEAGTVKAWRALRSEVIDPGIDAFKGRIVKLTGDGFLAEFPTVETAVDCALTMQIRLTRRTKETPDQVGLDFRMGVHLGDIYADDDDIYGDGVNIAARLEGLAEPGAVCISADV
jgi:adenylate cyclase